MVPASFSSSSSCILFFFLLLSRLACSCPVDWLYCNSTSAGSEVRACGYEKIQCRESVLYIQFRGQGPWYAAEGFAFPERRVKIKDTNLGRLLQSRDCDFLYNFTNPIRGFYPSSFNNSDLSIFFDCKPESYNFATDLFQRFGQSQCRDYDIYYSSQSKSSEIPFNCSSDNSGSVEWELAFEDMNGDAVEFYLRSVGFSHRRRLEPRCFSCLMSGGRCRNISNGNSTCRCNRECPRATLSSQTIALELWNKLPVAAIVGIGIAAACFLALIILAAVFFWRRRYLQKRSTSRSLSYGSSLFSGKSSSAGKGTESFINHLQTHIFTYEELEKATDGFDSQKELGDGGFGTVYKGKLKDGRVVAVKRLYENNFKRLQQFKNEIDILSRVRHQNLVTLYGCTAGNTRELLLVYEYVSNGTVADHLHGSRAVEGHLTWSIRMNIAIETAGALTYLHAVEPQIIHRDVKTNNILLDDSFHVKVADFGLSRLFPVAATHVSTAPQGTPGYLDPEYHQCYQLTDKSDVYSFGVVLVELISSKQAVDISRHRSEINLHNMFVSMISNGLLSEIVDPNLGYGADTEVKRMVDLVAELAFRCLQQERDVRPSMEEVWGQLMGIVSGDREEHRTDACKKVRVDAVASSMPFSPDTVTTQWVSTSTTPNPSG